MIRIKKRRGILLIGIITLICVAGCSGTKILLTEENDETPSNQSTNTTNDGEKNIIVGEVDDIFIDAYFDFGVMLFQEAIIEEKNSLVSPLSVMTALGMTANGAGTETKEEMEQVLGGNEINQLNEYIYAYENSLPAGEGYQLNQANSIWMREDKSGLVIESDFLATNKKYYNSQIEKAYFNDQTLKDINDWVYNETNGMINKIVDDIDPDAAMYLINAVAFDAEWETAYEKSEVYESVFTTSNGEEQIADTMNSEENQYLEDENAIGFMKDYKGGAYSFVALLPKEDITIEDYIKTLSGEELRNIISNVKSASVMTKLPKFSYEYELSMKEPLINMGMATAFNVELADFTKMGKPTTGNIFIEEVLHKTFISVDELGTKAGAVTSVMMKNESIQEYDYYVTLDRPFVYAIIDKESKLPIFIGTVVTV